MFSIFSYIMSRVTHSEPGLPMVQLERADIIHSQRDIKEIFDPESSPFH